MTNIFLQHDIWNGLVGNWEIPYLERVDPKHGREGGDLKQENARLSEHLWPAFTCSKWSRASRWVAENFRDIGSTSWPSGSGSWGFISTQVGNPNLPREDQGAGASMPSAPLHCSQSFLKQPAQPCHQNLILTLSARGSTQKREFFPTWSKFSRGALEFFLSKESGIFLVLP